MFVRFADAVNIQKSRADQSTRPWSSRWRTLADQINIDTALFFRFTKLSVRAKLCEDLRKSSERIADVAAVLAERTYSGNCHDGKMILDEVFQSDPAGRAQFLSLFRDELASGASELELVRKLNGGSLGIFEKPIEQATGLVVPP